MMTYNELWPSTRQEHNAIIRRFRAYCILHRVDSLPAAPMTFLRFLDECSKTCGRTSTVYLARAIQSWHDRQGYTDLASPNVERAINEIAKRAEQSGSRALRPLRPWHLIQLLGGLGRDILGIRDFAMFLLMYTGMLRGTELVALDVDDVVWQREGIILFCSGRYPKIVQINYLPDSPYCPVSALHRWLAVLPADQVWLFPTHVNDEFRGRLSVGQLEHIAKARLEAAGVHEPGMGVRSFRDGAIYTAFKRGIAPSTIYRQAGFRRWIFIERWQRILREYEPNNVEDYFDEVS